MKKILLLLLLINIGCQSNSEINEEKEVSERFSRDLQDIKESGKLKALTIYSRNYLFLV